MILFRRREKNFELHLKKTHSAIPVHWARFFKKVLEEQFHYFRSRDRTGGNRNFFIEIIIL